MPADAPVPFTTSANHFPLRQKWRGRDLHKARQVNRCDELRNLNNKAWLRLVQRETSLREDRIGGVDGRLLGTPLQQHPSQSITKG